jgi:hypothetical protein
MNKDEIKAGMSSWLTLERIFLRHRNSQRLCLLSG